MNIGWIIDADVSEFFDNLNHSLMQDILKQRVIDGGLLRYIGKWLNAGVVDGKSLSYPEIGTSQGGVISPMILSSVSNEKKSPNGLWKSYPSGSPALS